MLIEINPYNIDQRIIKDCVNKLRQGEVIIYPTDSVYAMGCDLESKKGLEKLADFKNVKLKKSQFSIICSDLSDVSNYVKQIDRPTFKLLKSSLPGPFTFVMNATNDVSRLFGTNRKEIGIRIPNNEIILAIVKELGNPIATTSLHDDDDVLMEYFTDPYEIYQRWDDKVDYIIDGGLGKLEATTVVDCTGDSPEILRQGAGEITI
ncbi:tRNA threonylcarbamoyl adenosine modification protein, Sua5/YciO/YrdC/YwlC family [Lishizhenia tianjinensis]|uniref:tRNA threonylcarbamoyl adenosine modification protein, Sua5/YciO/YrdC/YwlC family n=1 Tax=Lishizhenia tianjinensis TaxID=477690 RepID=A0A1I6YIH9_9FLAO|nr:L-threonylcarbamoyladenylate synthase [Lishizhenia tianjinensis]SFT50084.1 tRNA threonylcarbamoyl adenosine modification protein, Sua5/YciO/YrdC/YwlC family [Lishizhenia tianjinensis]